MTRVLQPEDLCCPVNGKHAYVTEQRALEALERAWTRSQNGSKACVAFPRRAYLCPDCGWWHFSSHWSYEDG